MGCDTISESTGQWNWILRWNAQMVTKDGLAESSYLKLHTWCVREINPHSQNHAKKTTSGSFRCPNCTLRAIVFQCHGSRTGHKSDHSPNDFDRGWFAVSLSESLLQTYNYLAVLSIFSSPIIGMVVWWTNIFQTAWSHRPMKSYQLSLPLASISETGGGTKWRVP